jgi:hypothetical protein
MRYTFGALLMALLAAPASADESVSNIYGVGNLPCVRMFADPTIHDAASDWMAGWLSGNRASRDLPPSYR